MPLQIDRIDLLHLGSEFSKEVILVVILSMPVGRGIIQNIITDIHPKFLGIVIKRYQIHEIVAANHAS